MRVTYVPNPNAADGRGVSIPAANILEYDGNPNGVIAAAGPALLLGSGSSAGNVWIKTATDSGNTGWVQTDPPDVGLDIHNLPAAASALLTNEFGVYEASDSPKTKKITGAQLKALINSPVYVETSSNHVFIGTEGGTYVQTAGNSNWELPPVSSVIGKIYNFCCMSPYGTGQPRLQVSFTFYGSDAIVHGGDHTPMALEGFAHVLAGNSLTLLATSLGWKPLSLIKLSSSDPGS